MSKDLNIMLAGFGGTTVQWTVVGRSCEAAGEPTDTTVQWTVVGRSCEAAGEPTDSRRQELQEA
jgi:hypothetical protein